MSLRNAISQLLPGSFKNILHDALYRPKGVKMGPHSLIVKPQRLSGRKYMSVGARCHVQFGAMWWCVDAHGAEVFSPSLSIGDDVYIGDEFRIMCCFDIRIGDSCVISDFVYFNDHNHGMNPWGGHIMTQPLTSKGPIHIGESCFIGFRSIVLSGVTLGHHCVVAAGSVVTTSYPDYSVIGGNPARLIKTATREDWADMMQDNVYQSFKGPAVEKELLAHTSRSH